MEEKLKESITAGALKRAEIRNELVLWQYIPVLSSIFESCKDIERESLVMAVLEEIAVHAWENGGRAETIRALQKE